MTLLSRTFYVAVDMQLFIMIPPLARLHSYNRRFAWTVAIALLVVFQLIRIVISVLDELGPCTQNIMSLYFKPYVDGDEVYFNKKCAIISATAKRRRRWLASCWRTSIRKIKEGIKVCQSLTLFDDCSERGGAANSTPLRLSRTTLIAGWTLSLEMIYMGFFGSYGAYSTSPLTPSQCVWVWFSSKN